MQNKKLSEQKLRRRLAERPGSLRTLTALALHYEYYGPCEKLRRLLSRATRSPVFAQIPCLWFKLAQVADGAQSLAAYERTTKLEPNCAEAWAQLGARLENPEEKVAAYRKAVALRPAEGSYFVHLGFALFDTPRGVEDGVEAVERGLALQNGDNEEEWYRLSDVYLKTGRFADAERAIQNALKAPDRQGRYLGQLAAILDGMGKKDEAEETRKQVLAAGMGWVLFLQGHEYRKRHQGEAWQRLVEEVLRQPLFQANAKIWVELAKAYVSSGEYAKGAVARAHLSVLAYEQALKLHPSVLREGFELLETWKNITRHATASAHEESAYKKDLKRTARRAALLGEARIRRMPPDQGHGWRWFILSEVYHEVTGQLLQAERSVRKALVDCPNHPLYLARLGGILEDQRRFQEAEDAYRSAMAGRRLPPLEWRGPKPVERLKVLLNRKNITVK